MNWLAFGYCVIAAMVLSGVVALCVSGIRALLRRSMAFFLVFTAASSLTSITAQKTNNVPPNMNAPQMQQGSGSFQTGFTGLTGLSGALPHMPSSLNPVNLVNPVQNNIPVQTTNADISRGWRIESVTTNAAISYVMPTNATLVGNWHVHGAASSFGMNVVDFGVMRTSGTLVPTNWSFPLGTNGAEFSSFWYFVDGRIRPAPKDAEREICAVGVPMSAVPGQSRLWRLDGDDGSRIITWENFFFGGDTNAPVSAQIELFETGDFITRSNGVETVCRRVNPDDWDDDGIENETDPNPLFCDGDFFGPANILPEGANTNAYCSVSVVATGPDALVVFEGDGPSNYPDPRFVARHGVTNEVFILIGKTYTVSSDWPIDIVGSSDPDTEVVSLRGPGVRVCRPVSISAGGGNPFTMYVKPSDLGGVFSWLPTGCGCTLSGSAVTFSWNCSTNCTCCGQSADGTYAYEGFWLPATSCSCGCYYNGEGPTWTDDGEDPDNSGPFAASVSATFSKSAVIFEDAYENLPGQWVGKRSNRTRLNLVAHGGPNGAALSVTSTNLGKLSHISGPGLPLASITLPANTSVSYAIVYEGAEASGAADDISVTATLTENVTGMTFLDHSDISVIEVRMLADVAAPSNSCPRRHEYGVHEMVNVETQPTGSVISLSFDAGAGFSCYDNSCFWCPWTGGVYSVSFSSGNADFTSPINVFEPIPLAVEAWWDGVEGTNGIAGTVVMNVELLLAPLTVSFMGIWVVEIPDESEGCPHFGYFDNPTYGRPWSHTAGAGAGEWFLVTRRNEWTHDRVGTSKVYPAPWSTGWKEWNIPIGWSDRINEIKGCTQPNSVTERFEIDESGTVTVRKFGRWIKRETNNHVWVDGTRVN